jgi:hypothetical protein
VYYCSGRNKEDVSRRPVEKDSAGWRRYFLKIDFVSLSKIEMNLKKEKDENTSRPAELK